MRSALLLFAGFAVGVVVIGGVALAAEERRDDDEDETPVAVKDIPPAVLATATRYAEGGALDRAVLEDEDGTQVYELRFKVGERAVEVQTLKNGDFFASEERVAAAAVPDVVKKRAAHLFKPGVKVAYERSVVVMYEAAAQQGGTETEFLLNAAGAAFQEIGAGDK